MHNSRDERIVRLSGPASLYRGAGFICSLSLSWRHCAESENCCDVSAGLEGVLRQGNGNKWRLNFVLRLFAVGSIAW